MELIRKGVINFLILIILSMLFSCKYNKNTCIQNVIVQANRNTPSLDVIMFDIDDKNIINKFKSTEIERVYFKIDSDTLDKIGYLRIKITSNYIRCYYKTTRFVDYPDSSSIKESFLKESVIFVLKDKSNFQLENCKTSAPLSEE